MHPYDVVGRTLMESKLRVGLNIGSSPYLETTIHWHVALYVGLVPPLITISGQSDQPFHFVYRRRVVECYEQMRTQIACVERSGERLI